MTLRILKKAFEKAEPLARSAALVALLAGLMAAGAAVPQAQAIDGKNYAGSECVKWTGAGVPVYSSSAIGNGSSTSTLFLDCPAVKDSINHSVSRTWVRAKDMHPTQAVRCNFNSVFMNASGGMSGWSTPFQSTGGFGTFVQVLNSGGLPASSVGHYYFSCRIPPRSSGNASLIATYRVDENN